MVRTPFEYRDKDCLTITFGGKAVGSAPGFFRSVFGAARGEGAIDAPRLQDEESDLAPGLRRKRTKVPAGRPVTCVKASGRPDEDCPNRRQNEPLRSFDSAPGFMDERRVGYE